MSLRSNLIDQLSSTRPAIARRGLNWAFAGREEAKLAFGLTSHSYRQWVNLWFQGRRGDYFAEKKNCLTSQIIVTHIIFIIYTLLLMLLKCHVYEAYLPVVSFPKDQTKIEQPPLQLTARVETSLFWSCRPGRLLQLWKRCRSGKSRVKLGVLT